MKTFFSELTPEQQELFNHLIAEGGFNTIEDRGIPKTNATTAPFSYEQQRLWFLDRFGVQGNVYNIPLATLVRGRIQVEALERAFSEIIRRHEVLRTSFIETNGTAVQRVNPATAFHLPVIAVQEQGPDAGNAELCRLVAQHAQQPFDLKTDVLLKAALFRINVEEHVLAISMHHIASDGWSLTILVQELAELYAAFSRGLPSPLQELAIQYADYSSWQREYVTGDALAPHLSYWTEQLKGVEALELPSDRSRPAQMSYRGNNSTFTLAPEVTRKLRDVCHAEDTTLFMCLLAIFQIVLYRYSGQHTICVGSPVAGRTREELADLIGFFVNTLVLKLEMEADPSFRELLQRARQVCLEAFEHQEVPFEKIVAELQPERDMARTPLFQVMFTLQTADVELDLPGLDLTQFEAAGQSRETAKFDLSMVLVETEAGLQGEVEYSTDLFNASTISAIIDSFKKIAQQVVESPDKKVSQLVLGEKNTPVVWSGPELDQPGETVIASLAGHVSRSPDSVAMVYEGVELTYGELDRQSTKIAAHLRALGAGLNHRIAVCLENPVDAITAMFGVLKCGGVIVPLEHSDPTPRLEYKLQNSGARWLMAGPKLLIAFNSESIKAIDPGEILSQPEVPDQEEAPVIASSSLAAVLFRSGPAGSPRAVLVRHYALRQANFASHLNFMPIDRIAICLGASTEPWLEAFRALAAGSCLAPIPAAGELSPRKVANMLRAQWVTVLFIHAGLLGRLGKEFPWAFNSVQLIVCDNNDELLHLSEKLPPQMIRKTYGSYGNSETGGRILAWRLSSLKSQRLTIKPEYLLAGTRIYVLDEYLRPLPDGVVGELFVAGEKVSPGYDQNPELTSNSFLSAKNGEERLYRTGDRVRHRKDGSLEFLGRADGCTVVQGVVIDPREIEKALELHPQVKSCAVAFRVSSANPGGTLSALFSGVENQRPASEDLASFLQQQLPRVMIPRKFIQVDEIPGTRRGKVDREAVVRMIEEIEGCSGEPSPYVAPRNAVERHLTQLWGKILQAEQIGVHDNFFRLGGHSLLATQLIATINDELQIDLPLRRLFESPTIEDLAPIITSMQAATTGRTAEASSIATITHSRREKYCTTVVAD